VAGRISDTDVALVRERAALDAVVREHLQLRSAGGGKLKGLCPFHEEKTPSFQVNPGLGFFHCFGCGRSGDVITFVRDTEMMSFTEAVEHLAGRFGVELHYEGGGAGVRQDGRGQRQRLVEANAAAQAFWADQLRAPGAEAGRQFLASRGFDAAAAERFGVGYAPGGWDVTMKHLLTQGFSREELQTGGLVKLSSRGTLIDVFRHRLAWPIRETGGDLVGFGGRRLADDDPAKYLNTGETPIYKKSRVLYGLDLAKSTIHKEHTAVVVEGYTDVMACHLAGVTTAVATCGTAFGEDHVRVLRQVLGDMPSASVIFTFDGDSAGRAAAEKAGAMDHKFSAQTFVAVAPAGQDPCELRLSAGDAAVRDLVAARVPLFEFVLRAEAGRHDLDTAEGRTAALERLVPVLRGIKDEGLRLQYVVTAARMLGFEDADPVRRRVVDAPVARGRVARPVALPADDKWLVFEREALKAVLQHPGLVGAGFDAVPPEVFTHPVSRQVHSVLVAAGGVAAGAGLTEREWVTRAREAAPDDEVRGRVTALAVEPIASLDGEPVERLARDVVPVLRKRALDQREAELKARLLRADPASPDYGALNRELLGVAAQKRRLREDG